MGMRGLEPGRLSCSDLWFSHEQILGRSQSKPTEQEQRQSLANRSMNMAALQMYAFEISTNLTCRRLLSLNAPKHSVRDSKRLQIRAKHTAYNLILKIRQSTAMDTATWTEATIITTRVAVKRAIKTGVIYLNIPGLMIFFILPIILSIIIWKYPAILRKVFQLIPSPLLLDGLILSVVLACLTVELAPDVMRILIYRGFRIGGI
jgi:hypothetical protein